MPFREDSDKAFWSVLLGFIISAPPMVLTIPKENIVYIIIYAIIVFIGFEIYFLIKRIFFYRKKINTNIFTLQLRRSR